MRSLKPSLVILFLLTHLVIGCSGGLSEAEKHNNAGTELEDQGRSTDAIHEFDEAIRVTPQLARAYNNRGGVYNGLGQYQRAIQYLDEAIKLDPKDAHAYAGRAVPYTLLGGDVEAQQDIDRAAELGFDQSFLERTIEELKNQR